MGRLGRVLGAAAAAEQDHFFYWVPVLFGAGIAAYFALPAEPDLAPLLLAAAIAMAVALIWRRGLAGLAIGGALASATLGLAAGKLASDSAAAPVLERELRNVRLTGWIELVEPRVGGGERITLRMAALGDLAPGQTPRRVRVRIPAGGTALTPGDPVDVRASLLPPAGPALPGAYDFGRTAWFMGLGAVGSARQRPQPIAIDQPMPLSLRLWVPVERLRQRISRRITALLPGETGAIAAALVTGERGGISEATNQAYRDSGIFHILSISGLHMTIFAGAVYVSARLLLSLSPALALRFEIKKWAAIAGLAGTFGYLLISGGSPPAVRSAVMLSVMFLAVLLDRPALALRNVAVAALVILVITPASLIDVGFQMSFAAVVALIAGVEAWTAWRRSRVPAGERTPAGPLTAAWGFLGTITLTTLLATVSVAPFAAYYFHKSTQYGVLANVVAVPICNLLVMPAALATLIAMPVGLEAWPLALMGGGIDAMTWVAYRVAAIPGAVTQVPSISAAAFGAMVAGGLWLCLWATPWRLLGLLPIVAGIAMAPFRETPDVLVGAGGALVGVRGADGRLAVLDTGRSSFELGRWLEHDADPRAVADVGPGKVINCDAVGCRASARGSGVAIVRHASALVDDCRRADLIVWLGEGEPRCRPRSADAPDGRDGTGQQAAAIAHPSDSAGAIAQSADAPAAATPGKSAPEKNAVVISRDRVRREGAHIVKLGIRRPGEASVTAISVETVADWRGRRPWSRVREAPLTDER